MTLKEINLYTIDNIRDSIIKHSPIHAHGLFTTQTISRNSILGLLDGQVIDWEHYDKLHFFHLNHLLEEIKDVFVEWNAIDEKTLLVRPFRTKYGYINHSRTPNCAIKHNPLRIVAIKEIGINKEITLDYRNEPLRKSYLEGHGKTYL